MRLDREREKKNNMLCGEVKALPLLTFKILSITHYHVQRAKCIISYQIMIVYKELNQKGHFLKKNVSLWINVFTNNTLLLQSNHLLVNLLFVKNMIYLFT